MIEDVSIEEVNNNQENIMNLKLAEIKVLNFISITNVEINYYTEELIALCPMTLIPDFYTLTIKYVPTVYIPELKSLKFYLLEIKDIKILHEHLAQKILHDFCDVVKPDSCEVYLKVNVRGGIKTEVICRKLI